MTDLELLDAYERAMREYEAVKLRNGDRPLAFANLLVAERALVTRLGQEVNNMRPKGLGIEQDETPSTQP